MFLIVLFLQLGGKPSILQVLSDCLSIVILGLELQFVVPDKPQGEVH